MPHCSPKARSGWDTRSYRCRATRPTAKGAASAVAVDLSNNMNLYETNLMVNRAHPDQVVVYPPDAGQPSTDEMKRVRSEWRKQYGGVRNAGRMGFLFGGAEIKNVSFSPKEMNYLGGRKWSKEEIFTGFGVPLSFTDISSVSRANADSANVEYQRRTIKPKLFRGPQSITGFPPIRIPGNRL